jgi:hypothetical protein
MWGNVKIGNKLSEMVEQFKYLGTTLVNKNSIHEEIKSRLKLGNAGYDSLQNLLFFCLLSKNIRIKIYRTIIFPVVLYGCETWLLIFGPKRNKVTGEWRRLHNEELCAVYS